MARIIVREKTREAEVIMLQRPRMTIGRSLRADIPLRDPVASRLHAVLQNDGPHMLLAEIGSASRTFLNGTVVREPRRLASGDVIHIGEAELTFVTQDNTTVAPRVTLVDGEHDSVRTSGTVMRGADSLLTAFRLSIGPEVLPETRRDTGVRDAPRDLHEIISRVGLVLIQKSSVSEVLGATLELVFQALPAERGFVFLREGGDVVCKIAATPSDRLPLDPPPRLSRTILSRALHEGTMVLTADARVDPRFDGAGSVELSEIRSVLAVPLVASGDILGAIYVDNDIGVPFSDSDLAVLGTIAAVASMKIEHERLLAEVHDKRRIEEELRLASEIQMRLLPMTPPDVPGWDLAGISLPCREVGGDYFDFIKLPARAPAASGRRQVGIAVGDVSGKGTGAALLIASVHAGLRAAAQAGDSVADVMRKLNQYVTEHAPNNRFVTLFYGQLDPHTGRLLYSNAGHEPPVIVRRDGAVERLQEGGIPIGIKDEATYDEGEALLLPGDIFVCYSDGLSDSLNAHGERFGEERIIDAARATLGAPACVVLDRIEEAVSQFVGTAAPVDDMTLVVATRA